MATGAAYSYCESTDLIVMAFLREALAAAAEPGKGTTLDSRLRQDIRAKLDLFGPHRSVPRALLRDGPDPASPLSLLGQGTKPVREADIAWLAKMVADQGISKDLGPQLPAGRWMYDAGIVLFGLIDEWAGQQRTGDRLRASAKAVALIEGVRSVG